MSDLRSVYAQKGLCQIPRLLSLQDRNPYSPTYGCFKRTYWLDKTVDFPDALPQFGVLSLTLAYTQDMPGNMFKDQPKMREWILAGMRFWTEIQHRDGSFDEFYPNEHGWTGPTGFLLYGMLKSYLLLDERGEFPAEFRDQFFTACKKAADYIIKWDEHGVLANHHAMAVLPVFYAHHVLGGTDLQAGYEKKLDEFLSFHTSEGWSLEYDGADIGYLSATVSFLGKVYKIDKDARLRKVMTESTEFLSHFVYPNGFYAGSMGSRNTLHFYSHGCEILAPEMPLAGRVADALLESLRDGKIVPAEIMGDRYFLYRIPEHLESYVDYGERNASAALPYERSDFRAVYPRGRYYVQKKGNIYLIGNAAKGGVTKVFRTDTKEQLTSDCGVIGKTQDGDVLTTQWIDDSFRFVPKENGFSVSGALHRVPANKLFTPVKMIVFRLFLLMFGWHTGAAYRIKGLIRKLLMLKSGNAGVLFYRAVELTNDHVVIRDTVKITEKNVKFSSLQLGDEFFVRYVPQSRYFQTQEFHTAGTRLTPAQLTLLNDERKIQCERTISVCTGVMSDVRIIPVLTGTMGLEYSEGRKKRKALSYRLVRRADEVIRSMRTHFSGEPRDLLDLGPAEGRSLSYIKNAFPSVRMVGLEYSPELIDACTDERLEMLQGDAMNPPFPPQSFDFVTATALIEHVEKPVEMLKKLHTILRPGGLVIITTPDPFFERIAGAIGHLDDEAHQETMTLKTLRKYLEEAGFEPVEVEKFMCWPWGLPFELAIEEKMKKTGLGSLLLNQLAVGRKKR